MRTVVDPFTVAAAGSPPTHARLCRMPETPDRRLLPLYRLARKLRQQWSEVPPVAWIAVVVMLLLGLGYAVGFTTGQGQAERLARQAEQETVQALAAQHAEELTALRQSRDQLRQTLQQLSEQAREQVTSAELSTEALADLRADLAVLRQRHAALESRYEEQSARLAAAEAEAERLRQQFREELEQLQQVHEAELNQLQQAHEAELEQLQRTHESELERQQQLEQPTLPFSPQSLECPGPSGTGYLCSGMPAAAAGYRPDGAVIPD